jgi:hypothetical protein
VPLQTELRSSNDKAKGLRASPIRGLEGGKTLCIREREDMVAFQGGSSSF